MPPTNRRMLRWSSRGGGDDDPTPCRVAIGRRLSSLPEPFFYLRFPPPPRSPSNAPYRSPLEPTVAEPSVPFISLAFSSPRLSRPFISRALGYTLRSFFLTSRSSLPGSFSLSFSLSASPFFPSLSPPTSVRRYRRRSRYAFFLLFVFLPARSHRLTLVSRPFPSFSWFLSLSLAFPSLPLLSSSHPIFVTLLSHTRSPFPPSLSFSLSLSTLTPSSLRLNLPSFRPVLPHHPRFFHARIHPRTTQEK